MRVLIVAGYIPFPPVGGGNTRIYHLLQALAGRHDLTLVAFSWGESGIPPPFSIRIIGVPWEMSPLYQQMNYGEEGVWQAAMHALTYQTEEPFHASFYQSSDMAETLRTISRQGFDIILIEGSYMARYLDDLPADVPKVIDFPDVHTLMTRREAEAAPAGEEEAARWEARRTLRYERKIGMRCAACLTVSDIEAAAVRTLMEIDHVRVVPNGVDTAFFAPAPGPQVSGSLLFTGRMDYPPNIDAACYFAREILPQIRQEYPKARFHIVGADPQRAVRQLASDDVIVHGRVPDMRPFFRDAEVVVAPIRKGGGTRLKILEAAACGKAVVSTPLGAEGLEFRAGDDFLVADSPAAFVQAVVSLARDIGRRQQMERRARAAAEPYDWDRIGSLFCHIIEALQ